MLKLSSRESEIDARIDELIEKMVDGTATDRERIEYQELAAQRGRLMRPQPRIRRYA